MIKKIKRLLRVKELKEEAALRVVQTRRREVIDAENALQKAMDVRDQSAKTYDARETRIYDEIMGLVIGQLKIDDTSAGKPVEQPHTHIAFKPNEAVGPVTTRTRSR